MQVINVAREDAVSLTARSVADTLSEALRGGQTVLWLVSGGSSLDVAVLTRQLLGQLDQPGSLHVGLIDERFGDPGHSDSNWQQLIVKGFDTSGVVAHPVLQGNGTIDQTAAGYNELLAALGKKADVCMGLLGMGADGHTAGLLPHNPVMESKKLVDHYQAADFNRITVTPEFISQLDAAFLYAVGEDKWPALELFIDSNASTADDVPVKLLKSAGELRVYTDYKGVIK